MKNFRLIMLITFLSATGFAQSWQWAKIESGAASYIYKMCADANSNLYYAGASGPGLIGGLPVPQSTTAAYTGFISKRDAQGNPLWTFFYPGISAGPMTRDNVGNIIAIGSYSSAVVIGSQTFIPNSNYSQLIFKINANGGLLWVRRIDQPLQGQFHLVKTDPSDNIIIAGWSVSSTITVSQVNLYPPASVVYHNMIVKLDPSGNYLWHNSSDCMNLSGLYDLAVDGGGNSVVTGKFMNQLATGAGSLVSAGSVDAYAIKYDPTGAVMWSRRIGGTMGDIGNGVSTDLNGNVYLTGAFSGTNVQVGNSVFSTNNGDDTYLAKLDPAGNFMWAKQIGSPSTSEQGIVLAAYNNGVALLMDVSGYSISIGASNFTVAPSLLNVALITMDPSGNIQFADMLDAGAYTYRAIALDNACGLYIASNASQPSFTVGSTTLTQTTGNSVYMARLTGMINAPVLNVTGTFSACIGSTISLQASGANSYTWSTGATGSSVTFPVNVNMPVTVTGTGTNLTCPATVIRYITVLPAPIPSIVASATNVCAGTQVTLTAGGGMTYTWSTSSNNYSIVVNPTVNTTYQVNVSNANCQAPASIQVITKAAPLLVVSGMPVSICAGDQFTLMASGADTYTWNGFSVGPQFLVSPANNAILTVAGTNTSTGCSNSQNVQVSVNACTGIGQLAGNQLMLYPNPAWDVLHIEGVQAGTCQLLNSLGQTLMHFEIGPSQHYDLDLVELPAGIYFIRSKDSKQTYRFSRY